jgi:hypothetical protein
MCVISRDHESSSEFSEHCAGRVIYQTAVGWQDVNGKNIERSRNLQFFSFPWWWGRIVILNASKAGGENACSE